MKKLLLVAGLAAFACASPAFAKPDKAHAGHAKGKAKSEDRSGRLFAHDARGACPPGLARKNNGCLPPGQAKKLYNVGQRYNRTSGNLWGYNQIPSDLRQNYRFDPYDRYYYNQGYLYQVDPKTMLVQQVVSALLR